MVTWLSRNRKGWVSSPSPYVFFIVLLLFDVIFVLKLLLFS